MQPVASPNGRTTLPANPTPSKLNSFNKELRKASQRLCLTTSLSILNTYSNTRVAWLVSFFYLFTFFHQKKRPRYNTWRVPTAEVRFFLLLCILICDTPHGNSPHTVSIHILDDDSLLNIFHLYRPAIFDGDEALDLHIAGGKKWDRERWWYKLAQVCQRWRILILASATHLGLCLVCTYGTPVADMLSHSPPLPLIIDYFHYYPNITAEDEEAIILALEQRHRVRRVRLGLPLPKLQKLIMVIDEEYPVLEYLVMEPPIEDKGSALMLPETLQAPHLRHASLIGFLLPTRFRLLTTAMGLVMLCLHIEHPSAYFPPNTLLHWLSSMPQLEMLLIRFRFPVPNRDVERQLMHTPIVTHVTLPNLRSLTFQGVSAYVEAVVRQITTPRLKKLLVYFYKQLTFSVPRLLQFVNTTENFRINGAKIKFFRETVYVGMFSRGQAEKYDFFINVTSRHLDWQVSSVAQIFNSLGQLFSTVEVLILKHEVHSQSSEEHNEVDRTEWRKILRWFSNVKTLCLYGGLVQELSRCLRLDDGELPLGLLPELQMLKYSGIDDTGDAFKSFVDARQNAGRPVTLVRSS